MKILKIVDAFSREHNPEHVHCGQVRKIAEAIMASLNRRHHFTREEALCLSAAAQLHDCGYAVNFKAHHKHSRDMILRSALPFSPKALRITAHTARYHRKAEPRHAHKRFAALDAESRGCVRRLAAILRVADGLDRTHRAIVKNVFVRVERGVYHFEVISDKDCAIELRTVRKKKVGLFEKIFGKTSWKVLPSPEVHHA